MKYTGQNTIKIHTHYSNSSMNLQSIPKCSTNIQEEYVNPETSQIELTTFVNMIAFVAMGSNPKIPPDDKVDTYIMKYNKCKYYKLID